MSLIIIHIHRKKYTMDKYHV